MSKQLALYFPHVCDRLFIVHLVVHEEFFQEDTDQVYMFTLLGLLFHYHGDYVL